MPKCQQPKCSMNLGTLDTYDSVRTSKRGVLGNVYVFNIFYVTHDVVPRPNTERSSVFSNSYISP
jgi:hypothetical protein